MAPPSDEDQTALGYRLRTSPQAPVTSFRDGFGNRVDLFNVATPYRELVVQARRHMGPVLRAIGAGEVQRHHAKAVAAEVGDAGARIAAERGAVVIERRRAGPVEHFANRGLRRCG